MGVNVACVLLLFKMPNEPVEKPTSTASGAIAGTASRTFTGRVPMGAASCGSHQFLLRRSGVKGTEGQFFIRSVPFARCPEAGLCAFSLERVA